MSFIIKTSDLSKTIKGQNIVSNVSMGVKKGEIYGLLGPNGAGKTSLMKMITGLTKPTTGDIELFGSGLTTNSFDHLKRMGSMIEYPVFYNNLTGIENLELHCAYMGYHDKNAIQAALQAVDLKVAKDKKIKTYSLGMKQRLGMARVIVTKPELLILDEPINGLDPVGILEMRNLLKRLRDEYGMTILISSHILSEIEHVADRIGIIDQGCLLREISIEEIKQDQSDYLEINTSQVNRAAMTLESVLGITRFTVNGEATLRVYDLNHSNQKIIKALMDNNIEVDGYQMVHGTLEEYFMNLIQGGKHSA